MGVKGEEKRDIESLCKDYVKNSPLHHGQLRSTRMRAYAPCRKDGIEANDRGELAGAQAVTTAS